METRKRIHLFQAVGIELEYMIVDKNTLNVSPVADQLIKYAGSKEINQFVNGPVTWSNELVMHVIELKCSEPAIDLLSLKKDFHDNILLINDMLKRFNAQLMPTAAHPWMNPDLETRLWPHDDSDIYGLYNSIFGCNGHGWSNLQSMHINLPFYDDEEFALLHDACRILLPILPALCASSPVLDGKFTGFHDTRLVYYQKNQAKIPIITGKVIPNRFTSKRKYQKLVYEPIRQEISPYDPKNILDPVWLNSRGVIPRFDRGSLEIRILDIQEFSAGDLAIAAFIIGVLKWIVSKELTESAYYSQLNTSDLNSLFQDCIKSGSDAKIHNEHYLKFFDVKEKEITARALFSHLKEKVKSHLPGSLDPWDNLLDALIYQGDLSGRIIKSIGTDPSQENLKEIYNLNCNCLQSNSMYEI